MEEIVPELPSGRYSIIKGNKFDQLAKSLLGTFAALGLGMVIDKAYDTLIIDGKLKELLSRNK